MLKLVNCTHAASTATGPSTINPHWSGGACPQVFYQNWIGKKPEFSGKPEEDAESHLFSTRDWMEVHNFPDDVKGRCFLLDIDR